MSDASFMLEGFREMASSDVMGGTVYYAGIEIPATVGTFDLSNPLLDGGQTPRLVATIEVAGEDLPAGFAFDTNQPITVVEFGRSHDCRILSWKPSGPLWQLVVHDINGGA